MAGGSRSRWRRLITEDRLGTPCVIVLVEDVAELVGRNARGIGACCITSSGQITPARVHWNGAGDSHRIGAARSKARS
jgi:hypothetical protein